MANSPSHQLGELIGDFFENAIIQYLTPIVNREGFYLDYRHPRPARGEKREVIGIDYNGNKHKLDIVVEEGGSETEFGTPKAFIEMAWRRYVKHSKNKVQEIAGAILPLIETYANHMPFYAAVLAGEFTKNSIIQLQSQGFYVLYINYEELCRLFDSVGISIRWEEKTSDHDLLKLVNKFHSLTPSDYEHLLDQFYSMFEERLDDLSNALIESLSITVSEVIVLPLHGSMQVLGTINDAVNYIRDYEDSTPSLQPFSRYEITVRFSNNDEFTMKCSNKVKAIRFLKQYIYE